MAKKEVNEKKNQNNKKNNKSKISPKVDKKNRRKLEIIIVILMVVTTVVLLIYFNNKKTLYKCSKIVDQSANGYKIKTYYDIYAYKENTNYIEIRENVYSDNNNYLSFYKDILKKKYENENEKYDGYEIKTDSSEGKVIVTVKIDMSKIKIKEFAKDKDALEYFKDKNITPDGFKKIFVENGATCN